VDQAFVTLATNDIYCQGALVLGQSLRSHRLTRKLVVLITPQVSSLLRVILSKVFDEVIEVNLIDSEDYIHLAFLKRPELGVTLSKLHCWTLTSYSKCVFLDADTLMIGCPEIETSPGIMCDPLSPPSPQFADFTETQTALPANKAEGGPPEGTLEPSQDAPAEFIRDPSPQDALEVDLAISVSKISIEEKVKELSPEQERRNWEEGHIDYMGKDAFARIQEKLDRFLQ
ncbi:glycogenin-2 isoform c, partial [Daubentonia madagascariensis]